MITYPWPPLAPKNDVEALQERTLTALGRAWGHCLEEREKILALKDTAPRLAYKRALARCDAFEESIEAFQDEIQERAQDFVDVTCYQYGRGVKRTANQLGANVVWGNMHEYSLISLASDTYEDLLLMSRMAGKTSKEFQEKIRQAAKATIWTQATNETAYQAGRRFWKELEATRIGVVIYRDGSVHGAEEYAGMVARTKGAVAFNQGAFDTARTEHVKYMEVMDGLSCGWAFHADKDTADGSIRPLDECMAFPISHPNCRRSFAPISETVERIMNARANGEEVDTDLDLPSVEAWENRKETAWQSIMF